jgi:hypothetical protein
VGSMVDVEAGSQQRGHTGFTVDRPSHGQPWLRTACRPGWRAPAPLAALNRAHPTLEPWPYVTRRARRAAALAPSGRSQGHGLAAVHA